ncbi:Olfactory receptor 2B11 [Sciurus carolinensis]|uniref:Olfactory receptor 2B11 n=1 Tax=Sciurus carolinensis TaxID=30640 RepID=A0AA41MDL2_SCICA|nr:Olfactory receptor 2B11 [Sciurus carolinensis]
MALINKSHPEDFIRLSFADDPWLAFSVFVILLITYPMAMMGNIAIILVCKIDAHLHSPMYLFLTNLSYLDMCYTTSIVPQMLFNLGSSKKTISYMGCALQFYLFSTMSFDHYVTICRPLHYTLIMNQHICILLIFIVWLCE